MADIKPQVIVLERRGRLAFWFAILFLLLFAGSLFVNMVLGGVLLLQKPDMQRIPKYQTEIIKGQGPQRILLLPIEGVIAGKNCMGPGCWSTCPETIERQLEQANADPTIKAIVLVINSPGGTITATDKIYRAIMKFKKQHEKPKPVIAYLDSVAASGGYYVACAADYIIAHETAITGSIGVIMSFFKFKELMGKIGIEEKILKRGAYKDMGAGNRDLTAEELKILNSIMDEMYARFTRIVQKRTGLSDEQLKQVAQGQVFTGKQALAQKLVDAVGYLDKALAFAQQKLKLAEPLQVIRYRKSGSLLEELMKIKSTDLSASLLLVQRLRQSTCPRFLYLWRP